MLLAFQEEAESDEHSVLGYQPAAERHKRILKVADTATKALVYFEKTVRKLWAANRFPVEQAVLTSAERTDFIRAFHRAMILATPMEKMSRTQLPSWWTLLDLRQVTDVMKWLGLYCDGGQQRDLGVCFDYQYSHQEIAGLISGERWTLCIEALNHHEWEYKQVQSVVNELYWEFVQHLSVPDQDTDTMAPYFPSLIRNHYQDQYRSMRGASLSDLVATVRERSAHSDIAYEISGL